MGLFSNMTDGIPPVEPEAEEVTEAAEPAVEEESTEAEETEAEESTEEGEDETVEVYEIDGEEVSAEQVAQWRAAFEGEQKSKEVQEQVAAEREALAAKSEQLNGFLSVFQTAQTELESLLLSDFDNIDLKQLREDDYQEYQRTRELMDERKSQLKAVTAKAQEVAQQVAAEQGQHLSKLRGWNDATKREADVKAFETFAKTAGFSNDDIKGINSARVMSALMELSEIKQKMSTKTKARAKVVPKTVKPKSKGTTAPKASLADRLFGDMK